MNQANVTFIGLGIMGSRMALNLLKNNVKLTVYNRSEPPMKKLERAGARVAKSAADAVRDADIVFSMLSAPDAVAQVFLGNEGCLSAMKQGAIWADCSTVNPSFTLASAEEAKKHNVAYLDTPVAGTKPQAQNAELVFFVGGEKPRFSQIEPLLQHMGNKVIHLGETGKGASFKMVVNLMLAQSMLIFSESVLLGEKMGLSRDFLLDTLPNLVVSPPFTKAKAEMIRKEDYEVQFPLELMQKDLHLATLTAFEKTQPLFLANLAKELYADAKKKGFGRLDFAAIHKYLEAGEV